MKHSLSTKFLAASAVGVLTLGAAACSSDGDDDTPIEDVGDDVTDVGDDIGDGVEDGVDSVGDEVDDATDG